MKRHDYISWVFAVTLPLAGALAAWPCLATPQESRATSEVAPETLAFSGYAWQVKSSEGSVGPGPNVFGRAGVWVDHRGYLHLTIARRDERWVCSEVILNRSLGYGEYRFVIQETANLDKNAVLGLFLWDPFAREKHFREVDIEVSRLGNQKALNAQMVIQPYARPENLERFELARGRAELSLRWCPGKLLCRAVVHGKLIHEHLFTHGVPEPGRENVRLNTWLYRPQPPSNGKSSEIVVEHFDYLPLKKGR